MKRCKQYRINDEVCCSQCGKSWSINEPAPCLSNNETRLKVAHETIEKLKRFMAC